MLAYGSDATRQFVTNVGLITSNGPFGDDIIWRVNGLIISHIILV